ncbi:class I SAM-dependent methyltransferase [Comamonas odontotermitis]|uniref:class I SAM-dependent methyltransferase n=1 Tax=Comamonas odontotermitis TaxID=379895 RepID=UPI0037524BB9
MNALLDAIAAMPVCKDAQRLFHGRGGLHPGCEHLSLDIFPPAIVLTSFAPLEGSDLQTIGDALQARWQQIHPGEPLIWVYQCRALGAAQTRLVQGSLPDPHTVAEDGARYLVHVLRGQNHGLFLDMAAGRRWVRQYIARQPDPGSCKVLNLFAYTCAFSVAALQAGAGQVINIDMGKGALATGQQNHRLNQLAGGQFWPHDIFSSWGKITRTGPYQLVIMDPPSYQKGSFVATKDYARLIKRLPDLLVPGGHALLCLNAPELPLSFLTDQVAQIVPELEFIEQVVNPPMFADVSPDKALKVLAYRMPG